VTRFNYSHRTVHVAVHDELLLTIVCPCRLNCKPLVYHRTLSLLFLSKVSLWKDNKEL
jgi:hypothetical protein